MKLWIEQKFDTATVDIKTLFSEAAVCYRSGAYRASLLFSYLGFLTHIKEIILKSDRPKNIDEKRWLRIAKNINDEDIWENRIYEELINSSSGIFNINDSIRKQISYWKDRRNDCAHFKQNEITYQHVEIFWSFLKSNLSKITIEGGMADLLKKIDIHFDFSKTPRGKDYSHLLEEIESSVNFEDFQTFLDELPKINMFLISEGAYFSFLYQMLQKLNSPTYKQTLIKFLRSNVSGELAAISNESKFINEFDYKPEEIRNLWHTKIYIGRSINQTVLASLLRNGSIPTDQLQDAMELLFSKFDQTGFRNLSSKYEDRVCFANKYLLDIISKTFFIDSKLSEISYSMVNSKADLIILLIEFQSLSNSIVEGIHETMDSENESWWLINGLRQLFQSNDLKRGEYETICTNLNVPPLLVL